MKLFQIMAGLPLWLKLVLFIPLWYDLTWLLNLVLYSGQIGFGPNGISLPETQPLANGACFLYFSFWTLLATAALLFNREGKEDPVQI